MSELISDEMVEVACRASCEEPGGRSWGEWIFLAKDPTYPITKEWVEARRRIIRQAITAALPLLQEKIIKQCAEIADKAAKEAGDPYCCVPWCETIATRIRSLKMEG